MRDAYDREPRALDVEIAQLADRIAAVPRRLRDAQSADQERRIVVGVQAHTRTVLTAARDAQREATAPQPPRRDLVQPSDVHGRSQPTRIGQHRREGLSELLDPLRMELDREELAVRVRDAEDVPPLL